MPTSRPRRSAPLVRELARRQVTLFVVAVCLPCVVVIAVGARLVIQERELADKRLSDHRRRVADGVAFAMLDRLDRIAADEIRALSDRTGSRPPGQFAHGATVLVAHVDSLGGQAPWLPASDDPTLRALAEPRFASLLDRAIRAELVDGRPATAAAVYREASATASDHRQAAYAELMMARALSRFDSASAARTYRRLVRTPLSVHDGEGVPIALYAAAALPSTALGGADFGMVRRDALIALRTRSLSPPACYAIADFVADRAVRARCGDLDDASLMMQNVAFISPLLAPQGDARPKWQAYAPKRWLVGGVVAAGGDRPAFLIILPLDSVIAELTTIDNGRVQLASNSADETVLGPRLGGLTLALDASDALTRGGDSGRSIFAAALLVVLGIGLLGAYLLWRDVQREIRLARLRSQFVASVSHELRTPLTSIRLFAETLRGREQVPAAARDEYLETIVHESERLTRLLDNVLDFSRIERGERSYRFEPRRVADLVNRVVHTLHYPLQQSGFQLVVTGDVGPLELSCDGDAVEQAILNLVANAIKYSGDSRRIELCVARDGGDATVAVRDWGVGIDASHQGRLFERFYRAPTHDNESIPGAGLGLSIVEHLALAHGGEVYVTSAVGRGSTFTLRLPIDTAIDSAPGSSHAVSAIRPVALRT